MSGYLLDANATILCQHGGQAKPTVVSPRIKLSGQPAVLQPSPHAVAGCPNIVPPATPFPCVTAQWVTGTVRVRSGGQPLLIQSSQAVCTPTGTGLNVIVQQVRVKAT